jgi:hypothetical protein
MVLRRCAAVILLAAAPVLFEWYLLKLTDHTPVSRNVRLRHRFVSDRTPASKDVSDSPPPSVSNRSRLQPAVEQQAAQLTIEQQASPLGNRSLLHGTLERRCIPTPDAARRSVLAYVRADPHACDATKPLCRAAQRHRQLLLTTAVWPEQRELLEAFAFSAAALRVPTLALVQGGVAQAATAVGNDIFHVAPLAGDPPILQQKWDAIARLVELGVHVLSADVDAVLASPPFELASNDSDIEALSEAWDDEAARGFIHGSDDPSMGWGRYAESMRVAFLSPSLVYLLPTRNALALARLLAALARAAKWKSASGAAWEAAEELDGEAKALTFELIAPAHDATRRVGASLRVLHRECFL